jgi:hypothetical protein
LQVFSYQNLYLGIFACLKEGSPRQVSELGQAINNSTTVYRKEDDYTRPVTSLHLWYMTYTMMITTKTTFSFFGKKKSNNKQMKIYLKYKAVHLSV